MLQLVAEASSEHGYRSVLPVRSQSVEYALLQSPYRTFLDASSPRGSPSRQLVVYSLPSSLTEYLSPSSQGEANYVRSQLYASINAPDCGAFVLTYDPVAGSFLGAPAGATEAGLISRVASGDASLRGQMASAALSALSRLDAEAASQVSGPRSDTVVLLGSGGREHALAVALARSPLVSSVIVLPGNGGTQNEGGKISNATGEDGSPLTKCDNATVVGLVRRVGAAMVVVGPEQPLVDGVVDELAAECPDVKVFGPSKAAAELEASKVSVEGKVRTFLRGDFVSSKIGPWISSLSKTSNTPLLYEQAFTKDFLQEHDIPTAKYRNFTSADEAIAYVKSLDPSDRQVVKASGLAAGKGVLLPTTHEETLAAVNEIMSDRAFGAAGDTCVVESFMTGPEASCLAFCDGKTAVLMPAAQDHKRALDGDEGLNTGGMGAYAPAPCVTPELQKEIEAMCVKTVEKMAERGTPYVGCLYAGMM